VTQTDRMTDKLTGLHNRSLRNGNDCRIL